ncbi:signal peptide protein [Candidatus Magnetoovum chiemensis]|nr:signal peptide protein [Candidatus Magnetoovum chiemensis]
MDEQVNSLKTIGFEQTAIYIDDEDDLQTRMYNILKSFYKEVHLAKNGSDGYTSYIKHKPDLVITDIMMPVKDGLTMAEDIKKSEPNQNIIIISAHNELQYFAKAIKIGVNGFILKPIETLQLINTLLKTSEQIKQNKENSAYKTHLEKLVLERTRELEDKSIELERRLCTDELTGIYNSVKMQECLKISDNNAVILLNIDNFGHINFTYGYEIGNAALKKVAQFLQENTPHKATLFRLTSDEFMYIFRQSDMQYVKNFAQEISQKIYNHHIELDNGIVIRLTFTSAISHGDSENLLKHAQIALVKGKDMGRNSIIIADNEVIMQTRQKENIYWMNKVKTALENSTIVPFYQPILTNNTNLIEKYECLARIVEGETIISPGLFVEPAKMVGLIPQLTKTIITKSFDYFKDKPSFEFSVNITQEDLRANFLVEFLKEQIDKYKIKPENVVLEILENISSDKTDETISQLEDIEEMGLKIAIDDFGSENSNFSRLLELRTDYLKLDGKFIKNIHNDAKSYKIVQAILNLSRSFNIKVIAEFVHCKEVQDKLIELGVDYSQGFYIGKPSPVIL